MSTMLRKLQALNPKLNILPTSAPAFERYGRVLTSYDVSEVMATARAILPSSDEIVYEASVPALELPNALNTAIAQEIYGGMSIQVGSVNQDQIKFVLSILSDGLDVHDFVLLEKVSGQNRKIFDPGGYRQRMGDRVLRFQAKYFPYRIPPRIQINQ